MRVKNIFTKLLQKMSPRYSIITGVLEGRSPSQKNTSPSPGEGDKGDGVIIINQPRFIDAVGRVLEEGGFAFLKNALSLAG